MFRPSKLAQQGILLRRWLCVSAQPRSTRLSALPARQPRKSAWPCLRQLRGALLPCVRPPHASSQQTSSVAIPKWGIKLSLQQGMVPLLAAPHFCKHMKSPQLRSMDLVYWQLLNLGRRTV